MPIIDVRTVETLFEAGLISSKQRDLGHYEEYRLAIEGIRQRCPGWTVRQIDRALFAYHKQVLDKKARKSCGQSHKSVPVNLEQAARSALTEIDGCAPLLARVVACQAHFSRIDNTVSDNQ
jgi:hypothetical protein